MGSVVWEFLFDGFPALITEQQIRSHGSFGQVWVPLLALAANAFPGLGLLGHGASGHRNAALVGVGMVPIGGHADNVVEVG